MVGLETRDKAWYPDREDWSGYTDELDDEDLEFYRLCGQTLDNGEGYNGLCGDCSDAAENRKHAPAMDAHLEMALEDAINGGFDVDQEPF